jgi:hypothetical protein
MDGERQQGLGRAVVLHVVVNARAPVRTNGDVNRERLLQVGHGLIFVDLDARRMDPRRLTRNHEVAACAQAVRQTRAKNLSDLAHAVLREDGGRRGDGVALAKRGERRAHPDAAEGRVDGVRDRRVTHLDREQERVDRPRRRADVEDRPHVVALQLLAEGVEVSALVRPQRNAAADDDR